MYITFLFSISKNLSLVKTFVFLISAYRFQQLLQLCFPAILENQQKNKAKNQIYTAPYSELSQEFRHRPV